MPYIDIPSRDDYVSIWYITNSVHGNVGSFDPARPTCILLHPLFLDSSWLIRHFDDPRLSRDYNLIAFDQRTCGRSRCRPSQWHDSYVDAADIAMVCQALLLPPAHILAFECISVNAALRLAALWPEQVLSLTLCDVPPPTELQWVFHAYDELLQLWCYAPDLDSFEHAGNEVVTFMTGESDNLDLQDDLIAYWEKYTPPTKRLRIVELVNIMMNRTLMRPEEFASIGCPVLIIQGEASPIAPLKYAENLKQLLINARDGPRLYVVRGAKACLNILPGSASIVNQVFSKFLAQQPRTRSDLLPPKLSIRERSKVALSKLAEFVGIPSIAQRDPCSPLSFSCVKTDVAKSQLENLLFYAKGLDKAYCPLGRDGRPLRKYSERKKEAHWFQGDKHGNSYIDTSELKAARNYKGYKKSHTKTLSSPERPVAGSLTANKESLVTDEVAQDGRMRRTTYNASSVDKHVIRGTMQKVVTQSAQLPRGVITKALLPS
jgi:pimeloyl-ACP methyl ester carboxylesterase